MFNCIFDSGIIPESWLTGNVKPIYKNKGNHLDPNNFRPITILSCFGKLFTAVLLTRLNAFSEKFSILNENQSGFRKGYSTIDNIFVLYAFFELLKLKKKKLFVTFVDFEKAFDKVWRDGLWCKLLLNNINGKMYKVIYNMYQNIKSRIVYNNAVSDFFDCNNGVRQGENLSPFLFLMYLNDLEQFLNDRNVNGLTSITEVFEIELDVYLKLFVLLYADDTVIMSESKEDMQNQLNVFNDFCKKWKLKVNAEKSKVLVFSNGRLTANLKFTYNNRDLEIVPNFSYLGITFSKSGSFNAAKKDLVNKSTKAMYEVLKKGRLHNLSIQCQLDIFDKTVKPILLYGCETWGFGKNDIIERVHLKFCKLLLHVKTSTPNFMVYGELGRYPIDIDIKVRMISYWTKLILGNQSKISSLSYKLLYIRDFQNKNVTCAWLNRIRCILNDCGMSYIWNTQNCISDKWLKLVVKNNLVDQFKQTWTSMIEHSSKGDNYKLFKHDLKFEDYLDVLDDKDKFLLVKFRTSNHRLPIEVGRWRNIKRENRICNLCIGRNLGDEFHYLFECPSLSNERKKYFEPHFINRPNILKFCNLMYSKSVSVLCNMCKYIRIVNMRVCPPG